MLHYHINNSDHIPNGFEDTATEITEHTHPIPTEKPVGIPRNQHTAQPRNTINMSIDTLMIYRYLNKRVYAVHNGVIMCIL